MQLSRSFQHPVNSRGSSGSGSLVFLFSLHLVKTNSVTVACFCRSGPGTSKDVPADTHLKTTPPSHPPVPLVAAAAAAAAVVQRPDRRPCTRSDVHRLSDGTVSQTSPWTPIWARDLYFTCEPVRACAHFSVNVVFFLSLQTCKMWLWEKCPFLNVGPESQRKFPSYSLLKEPETGSGSQ